MSKFVYQTLKSRTIIDIGGSAIPINDLSEMIDDEAKLTAHYPTVIRDPFFPDLLLAASFTSRMQEFNAVRIDHPKHRGGGQEIFGIDTVDIEGSKQT